MVPTVVAAAVDGSIASSSSSRLATPSKRSFTVS